MSIEDYVETDLEDDNDEDYFVNDQIRYHLREILALRGEDKIIPYLKKRFDSLPSDDTTKQRIKNVITEIVTATVDMISDDQDNQMKIIEECIFGQQLLNNVKSKYLVAPPYVKTIMKR